MVVPLEDQSYLSLHKVVRIILTKATRHTVRGVETAAGFVVNAASHPGNAAVSALSSLHQTADNRARLNRAGIDPGNFFSAQFITESHQKRAMEELLRDAVNMNGQHNISGDLKGIVLENGRTIWVCDRCHDCLQRGESIEETKYLTLSQYIPLVKRESEVNATLYNPESVVILTETFTKPSQTKKMTIHIDPEYFEAPERAKGSRFNSIVDLFHNLGTVLQHQKVLTHLDLHGNSTNGALYAGLQVVLKCQSLEILHVSGIPCFLQGKDLRMKCKGLKELVLQSVLVDTEQTANNLRTLIGMCSGLTKLTVTSAEFTSISLITLFLEKPKEMRRQFAKLEHLDLSYNDLDAQEAIYFVNMTLASERPRLRYLYLSGNPRIGDANCRSIFELLQAKQCKLEEVKMEDTGIASKTSRYIDTYLSRRKWANIGINEGYASYLDYQLQNP
ncbi:hypothetical protein BGZ65_000736 [Modicella reniformis]|uniref:Uncharacterized protein n=1 Tax=Modicella reniformis TaxID=1440133 RepID=A0A9P6M107_9FUNG|nr:hypothetical protein BGZ65_000736 [Modicella reniformis]